MPADLLLPFEFLFASRAFSILLFPLVDTRTAENSLTLLAQLHGLSHQQVTYDADHGLVDSFAYLLYFAHFLLLKL